jgi:hypothetical protein
MYGGLLAIGILLLFLRIRSTVILATAIGLHHRDSPIVLQISR